MGKPAIDFSTGVADLDNAIERMKKNEEQSAKKAGEKPAQTVAAEPAREGKAESDEAGRPKAKKSVPKKSEAKASAPDPMVNKTFKVKHSRAEQFRRLVFERKLAGVDMATQQELLDEALKYVLDRYAVRSRAVQD